MFQTLCICGAGTMGRAIAQISAQSGIDTVLYDVDAAMLEQASLLIKKDLQLLVEKNKISAGDMQVVFGSLRFTSEIEDCTGDIIIEAIIEKTEVKVDLFNRLAAYNKPDTVFASNTSSLSITALAEKTDLPERVIGMHFFNPATIMKLVEVVNTFYTNEKTTATIIELAKKMGKTCVICKDAPGFIVNHVARPYYLESLRLVEQELSDYETIDILMEATGFKMGPFKLMDLIGNDINYAVSCSVYDGLLQPARLKPSTLQKEKLLNGALGKKTGKGFYQY